MGRKKREIVAVVEFKFRFPSKALVCVFYWVMRFCLCFFFVFVCFCAQPLPFFFLSILDPCLI